MVSNSNGQQTIVLWTHDAWGNSVLVPHATCEVQVVEGVAFINFLNTKPKTESTRQQHKSEGANEFIGFIDLPQEAQYHRRQLNAKVYDSESAMIVILSLLV